MTPAGKRRWQAAQNVLLVRLDNLGDVLMTTPAIAAVRRRCTGRLTLLASTTGALAAQHVPALDEVIVYDAPWVKAGGSTAQADRQMVADLLRRHFDAAIVFTVCTQSALPAALMCQLAGIPLRLAHSRENPYGLLSHWVGDADVCAAGMRHEVRRQLDLVGAAGFEAQDGALVFSCLANDRDAVRRKLADAGHAEAGPADAVRRPLVVIHPGSTAPSRRYPPERFGQAAALIVRATGARAVFVGGQDDVELVRAAQSAMRSMGVSPGISLAGESSLGELGALIEQAALVVCNNSAPAHIAAAVGTPVVVLYALTNPQHTPWQVPSRVLNHDVPCRNCLKSVCPQGHHRCLLGVSAEAVAEAALALLHECRQSAVHRARTVA